MLLRVREAEPPEGAAVGTGRGVCEELMRRGVLAKDTHGSTIRLAPPIVITEEEVDELVSTLGSVLRDLREG